MKYLTLHDSTGAQIAEAFSEDGPLSIREAGAQLVKKIHEPGSVRLRAIRTIDDAIRSSFYRDLRLEVPPGMVLLITRCPDFLLHKADPSVPAPGTVEKIAQLNREFAASTRKREELDRRAASAPRASAARSSAKAGGGATLRGHNGVYTIVGVASRAAAEQYVKDAVNRGSMFLDAFAAQGGVDYVTVDGAKGRISYTAPRKSPWTASLAARMNSGPGAVGLR